MIPLNDAQRAAVEHPEGPLLVVAGAGSGKTRVLTARVQRLLEGGVAAEAVVAFTFTNRAAREMRERIDGAVGERAAGLWIGTFHGIAVRILRREAAAVDRPREFAIYDREDQEALLREIVARLHLPEAAYRVGSLIAKISQAKSALIAPEEAALAAVSPFEKQVAECYRLYRDQLRSSAAFDFDDLITETVRLFRDRPEIAERYSRRFHHVLVDEYQDTNHAQFRLVEALGARYGNVFVVGDDDQSIYGWRGADLSNVLEFERVFPGAAVIRLEQNYRSTATILRAANAVISNNRTRKPKTLWCERENGANVRFTLAADELEEARRIAAVIDQHRGRGGRLADCAVLYRTHAQSRAIETELRQRHIPYEIVGGVSFYQRREIKDLLAYLRLALNPADTASFWRVWNTPRRGLGAVVRSRIEECVASGAQPLDALRHVIASDALARGARAGAESFVALLDEIRARRAEPAESLLRLVIERTRYLEHLGGEAIEGADERRGNVEELVAAAAYFSAAQRGALEDFLAESALLTDADRLDEDGDRALLLTAHNAKGLEFPLVIVAGLEEGLFPHANSLEDPARLEEERRLFYVALTRARDEVVLTAAAYRRRFAADGGFSARGGAVSRFVEEIPPELLTREGEAPLRAGQARVHRSAWRRGRDEDGIEREIEEVGVPEPVGRRPTGGRHRAIGREVYHDHFGRGVVVDADGEGGDARYTVRFGTTFKKVLGRFLSGGSDGDPA